MTDTRARPCCRSFSRSRRIRDEEEGWVVMERYMTRHQVASLTHGICPECEARTMAEVERGR